jgi:hypothetical protein
MLVAILVRVTITMLKIKRDINRETSAVFQMNYEQLIEITRDPGSPRLGFAMGELERRGIRAIPSLSSICEMLVSDSAQNRGNAMVLLGTLYPEVWSRAKTEGWSNRDTKEMWQSRVELFFREG